MGRWEPDAQRRLREAALELFEEQGYDQTTVAQIAGLDGEATRRTFRARYWTRTAAQSRAEHQSCTTVRSL